MPDQDRIGKVSVKCLVQANNGFKLFAILAERMREAGGPLHMQARGSVPVLYVACGDEIKIRTTPNGLLLSGSDLGSAVAALCFEHFSHVLNVLH